MKKLREWYLTFLTYLYFKIDDEIQRNIDKLTSKKTDDEDESEDENEPGSVFDFMFCNIEKIKTEDELKRK